MRILLSLLLAVTASAAFAADPRIVTVPDQAPPQAPAPSPAPKPSQPAIPGFEEPPVAQPGAGQSGTEQSPWFVRVLPQPKTVAEAAAEKREQDARAANERGVTKYARYLWRATAALTLVAAIQAGLFVWQLILLRRSVGDAATAANAANASAEAAKLEAYAAQRMLVLTQRPKLRIRNVVVRYPVPIHRQPFRLFELGQPISGQFYVVNLGGTVARVVEGDCRVYWTEQGLPMERPYEGQQVETVVPPYKLEAGQSNPISFQSSNVMGPEGCDISMFAGNWRLYIMGWIEYTDDLDNHRRTAFCREYRQIPGSSGGRFFPVDDPDYEHEE